jgi:hypothetical protein
MGYQPRIRSPKHSINEYTKPFREKRKDRKRIRRRLGRPVLEEKHAATEREISELTLKRLHTLGNQRFGSFPFSEHFNRWLSNVSAVLSEFESHPNVTADEQFLKERAQTFEVIILQLEERRKKETSVNQEITNLSYYKSRLKQINTEYATIMAAFKNRKNREIKRLYSAINRLKNEQNNVIRLKTGLFRGISKNKKELKEIEIAQELSDKQRELELVMLNFSAEQRELRDEHERRREPVLEQIKFFQKKIGDLEEDGSLEERWFACEALIDAVNTFLQRKATPPSRG